MSDSPILTVEASYRTEVSFVASNIELDCEGLLKPAPKGIYCSGKLEPALVDGKEYFYRDSNAKSLSLKDINEVNTAIYDSNGKCVIPLVYMKKRTVMVSNEPFMPYRGMQIVKDLVTNQIDRSRTFKKYPKERDAVLKNHFLPNLTVEQEHDALIKINEAYSSLEAEVYEFLANHSWNIFFVNIQNTKLILEKSLDYRAFLWEQEHGEAWRNGKYHPAY